jgi:hypothetical protein
MCHAGRVVLARHWATSSRHVSIANGLNFFDAMLIGKAIETME